VSPRHEIDADANPGPLVLIRRRVWPRFPTITIARAAEVSGTVVMSEVCSPEVSPAVVVHGAGRGDLRETLAASPAEVALVNQRGLQFVPRVQAITLGAVLAVHQRRRRDAQRPHPLAGERL